MMQMFHVIGEEGLDEVKHKLKQRRMLMIDPGYGIERNIEPLQKKWNYWSRTRAAKIVTYQYQGGVKSLDKTWGRENI